MSYAIETINLDEGVEIKIFPDDDPTSPREWDNLGTMYCWHPDYTLGDEQFTQSDFDTLAEVTTYLRHEREARIILPLFLLDHSGLRIRAGADIAGLSEGPVEAAALGRSGRFIGDGAGWDTTMVGFIYVSADKLREEYSVKRITKSVLNRAKEALQGEVEVYDQYLSGDVYGYVIEDEEGETLDSVWGFYGSEEVEQQAKGVAEQLVKDRQEIARRNALVARGWRD